MKQLKVGQMYVAIGSKDFKSNLIYQIMTIFIKTEIPFLVLDYKINHYSIFQDGKIKKYFYDSRDNVLTLEEFLKIENK